MSLEVTSEEVHDDKMLKRLIDNASENSNLKGVLADDMYDSNGNFRYLSKNHIKSSSSTILRQRMEKKQALTIG